ncbi:hypothetical protein [Paenibacillus sp. S150]|uniref:hypothetical protein n=1 Tax=Paenibacillus sp. S150 TaxID=2749826 RepID=UPI001C562B63|nr:hypothetical protein [Paenibacillus sp. S150]MBW4084960.1 hypothetical protein [Paenibacillus sp. S150]
MNSSHPAPLPGLSAYIDAMERPDDFTPTGYDKELYLDLMEAAIQPYGLDRADNTWGTDREGRPQDLQTYCRIISVLAGLIAAGRQQGLTPLWESMMETGCRELPLTKGDQMADFCTKELLLAYKSMKPHASAIQRESWRTGLAEINPAVNYVYTLASIPDSERLHNINLYNMAGEYLRETEGMTDAGDYLAAHWPVQLPKFDGNGMYRDPGCPLLYDLAARCHIQLMFAFGYRGAFYGELDRKLAAGGMMTLFMQSAAGHFPFGGRSGQFQFNEALAAACAEFEAARYRRLGSLKLAGAFKRSARLSAGAILRWVRDVSPPRHVKNLYDIRSGYGTEPYAYYDKYMITLGSFAYMAYLFTEDDIAEQPCPAERGGYVLETSPSFHKVFAAAGGLSVQLDTAADHRYDATGLGRLHRAGFPAELALSSPLCAVPAYRLPERLRPISAAVGPGWEREDGTADYLSGLGDGLEHVLSVICEESARVEFSIGYCGAGLPDGVTVQETYVLSEKGLDITAAIEGPDSKAGPSAGASAEPEAQADEAPAARPAGAIRYRVPLFCGNGQDRSSITAERHAATVALGRSRFTVSTTGDLEVEEERCGNRNGEYRLASIRSNSPAVRLRLRLWSEEPEQQAAAASASGAQKMKPIGWPFPAADNKGEEGK